MTSLVGIVVPLAAAHECDGLWTLKLLKLLLKLLKLLKLLLKPRRPQGGWDQAGTGRVRSDCGFRRPKTIQ